MSDEHKPTIDERLEALTMNLEIVTRDVEMLAGSAKDLRASVEATLTRQRGERERDAQYLRLIGEILSRWANGENGQAK